MAQKIYYQWQDDDSTFDFNINQLLTSSPAGRYYGYDFGATAVSSLPFSGGLILGAHATGVDFPTKDNITVRTPKMSVLRTQQGETITEDDAIISLPITANSSGLPRIDLIVCEHEYVDGLVGGDAATYSVIMGTPDANPVAPSVASTEKQTAIGTLYVPDGLGISIADIQASDWTPANVPNFASDSTIPHTNIENTFEQHQAVLSIATGQNTIKLTTVTSGIDYVLNFGEGGANGKGNSYLIWGVTSGSLPSAYAKVFGVSPEYITDSARVVNLYSIHDLQFISLANGGSFLTPNGKDVYVRQGTPIVLQKGSLFGIWEVVIGGQVNASAPSKLRAILSSNFEEVAATGTGKITHTSQGNQILVTDTSLQEIEFIASNDYTLDALERGTQITIHANEDTPLRFITQLGLSMGQVAPPAGYKRVWNPLGYDITVCGGGSVTLVETETHWKVISIEGEIPTWYDLVNGTIAVTSKVARMGNLIFFDFPIQIHQSGTAAISANSGNTLFSLPSIEQYPNNDYTFGLPNTDNPRFVHFRTGTNVSNYSFSSAYFEGTLGFSMVFHAAIGNSDNVWWLTDGIFFRAKN